MELYSFLITLTISSIWGYIGYNMAKKRNLNPKLWAALLAGFGFLAFIFLIFKKKNIIQEVDRSVLSNESIPLAKIIQDNWYFLGKEQERNGPINFEELKKEFELGNLNKKSFVWNTTYSDWKKLEEDLITLNELEKRS